MGESRRQRFGQRHNPIANKPTCGGIVMKFWLLGITFSLTVTLGTYVFSLYHSTGGETRVSYGRAFGPFQNGTSICIRDCAPDSAVEKFQGIDFSRGPVALSATRSDGEISADVGLQKEFSTPDEGASVTIAATKSLHGEDAIYFLHLPVVRSMVPDGVNNYIKDYEVRKAAQSAQRMALFNRLTKPNLVISNTFSARLQPNNSLFRVSCTAHVTGTTSVQETPLQKALRQYQCMKVPGI
jgi:hypothetical protein